MSEELPSEATGAKRVRKKRDPNISKHTGKPKDMRYARHPLVMKNSRTPEVMEKVRAGAARARERSKEVGGRTGIPDGCTRAQAQAAMEKATQEAKEIVRIMAEKGMIDEEALGNEALQYAVSVIRAGIHQTREKLQAAKLVLEYTKAKPAQKSEVSITKAEDFLSALLAKENGES